MKKTLLLLLTVVITLSCKDFNTSSKESLKNNDFSQVKGDNVFELSIPKYMKAMDNLNEDATLQYANIFKEVYSVVIYENKEGFINTFKEYGEYNDSIPIIENYKQAYEKFLGEIADVEKIEPYELTSVNGLNARQIKMYAKVENVDIAYVMCFIESKENLFSIMNWTLPGRFNKYEDTFIKINNSFQLLNN